MSIDLFGPLELAELRELAYAALPDTGRIVRGAGSGTLDDDGVWHPDAGTEIYNGRLRIRGSTVQDSDIVFGDTAVSTSRLIAVLPYDAADVHVDDVIYVDQSSDPLIADHSFRIRIVTYRSYLTDRRVGIEIIET